MARRALTPTVQLLLDRMNSALETLDTLGVAVADEQIESGPHIGRTMIHTAATLSENLMAIERVLTNAGAMETPCPTPYDVEGSK